MNRLPLFTVLALALVPALIGCPKKTPNDGKPGTPVPGPSASLVKMAHGSSTVALPEPENPVVAVRLAFRTGSADDPKGEEGLTSLTASLMAEGGTQALTSSQLVRALYPMAAHISVQADREMTVFSGVVHRDHLAAFLPIMADVVLQPRMDPKEFERLKTDALNSITLSLRTSDDENLGKEALESMLAAGHPYAHPSVGTEAGLKSITMDDVIAHRKRAFGQARLTVGIAGGYDRASLGAFEARISTLPMGDGPADREAPAVQAERNFLVVEKPAESTAISLGFNTAVKRGDPDFFKLRLAACYIGEHRQQVAKLFDVIREKRGLNYGDYAYVEEFVQEGGSRFPLTNIPRRYQHFEIWLRPVETKNAVFALRAALWQFEAFTARGMSKEDFESTRDYLVGYSRLWEQTADRRLGYAIDGLWYGSPDYLASFRKQIQGMTVDEVNAAIKKHLGGRALQIAIVTGDGKAMEKTLVDGKPTPPKYASPKPQEIQKEDKIIQSFPLGADAAHVKVVPSSQLF